jgi:radical SAM-linked protein
MVSQVSESPPPPADAARLRGACVYSVDGDLRYLSHQDELRMLARALVRAEWPLRWSQGFNPKLRLSIVLPRSVGTAADGQLALADLAAAAPPEPLFARLAECLPAGCRLARVVAPAGRGTPHPLEAEYATEIEPPDRAGLAERIAVLLARETVVIQRRMGPGRPTRPVDLRPGIERLEGTDGVLRMRLRAGAQPAARPSEIITELGLPAGSYVHRLRRVAVRWDTELSGPDAGPHSLGKD